MLPIDTSDPRSRRALFALLFYAVATLLVAAPLPLHAFGTVARAVREDVWLNVWALAWTSEHLLTAPAGLFDANIFFPHENTLAYTDHFIGEALLAAPFYWVTGSAVVAYNVAWFAALVLTGWGGYLWVRCLIDDEPAGEAAALVAGAVCLLVPAKRTAFSHLQVLSLQGVTLSLYAAHRLLKQPGWRAATGLTAASTYAALSSWYTAAYAALLLPAVGLAGILLPGQTRSPRRTAAWGVSALLLTVALMAPIAAPFRAVQQELAFERPVEELVATSLRPVDLVSSWSWLHSTFMPEGSGAGGYFPGLLAFGLGLIGLRAGWRRRDPWPLVYGGGALVFAILSLGPRLAITESLSIPLPYAVLYQWVPGFGALRNPYRAAFIATLLFAAPVGYGAREVIAWVRARALYRQRWSVQPRVRELVPLGWALAAGLALIHLFEAWPGPQEIADLPGPRSAPYEWLAANEPGAAAFVFPLPGTLDDNARYQLWTIGNWVPLINGHSGLYPPAFAELDRFDSPFPTTRFLDRLREGFPVRYVVIHYDLDGDADRRRAAVEESEELEEVWSDGADAIYRLDNGSGRGWLRRRLPRRLLGDEIAIWTPGSAAGCDLRVVVDGAVAGEARIPPVGALATGETAYTIPLSVPDGQSSLVVLEAFLVEPGGVPRVELTAELRPARRARLAINGQPALDGPLVVAVFEAGTGRLLFERSAAADEADGGAALRGALEAAGRGDELVLAIAEELDYMLIERLRLLLTRAGATPSGETLDELGTTYAFRGTVGAPAGSATERFGDEAVGLAADDPADCRLAPIVRFTLGGEQQ